MGYNAGGRILVASDDSPLPSQYGTGVDGVITVTSGTVNIEDIYEDINVTGVTTKNGVGKGLAYGAGAYDPKNGAYIKAISFTIDSGATLTHGTKMGSGSSDKNGIIWIACTGTFTNNGTINLDEKGYNGGNGGAGAPDSGDRGYGGSGSGAGSGGEFNQRTGGSGGSTYGTSDIPSTIWAYLYGSGAGGGGSGGGRGDGVTDGASGSAGSPGGGALRIYAKRTDVSGGTISVDGGAGGTGGDYYNNASTAVNGGGGGGGAGHSASGATGGAGGTTYSGPPKISGAGGGGSGASGGTVYIESATISILGTNKIACSGGAGGSGGTGYLGQANTYGSNGSAGSAGRIHIVGAYTGSTADPAIA